MHMYEKKCFKLHEKKCVIEFVIYFEYEQSQNQEIKFFKRLSLSKEDEYNFVFMFYRYATSQCNYLYADNDKLCKASCSFVHFYSLLLYNVLECCNRDYSIHKVNDKYETLNLNI